MNPETVITFSNPCSFSSENSESSLIKESNEKLLTTDIFKNITQQIDQEFLNLKIKIDKINKILNLFENHLDILVNFEKDQNNLILKKILEQYDNILLKDKYPNLMYEINVILICHKCFNNIRRNYKYYENLYIIIDEMFLQNKNHIVKYDTEYFLMDENEFKT